MNNQEKLARSLSKIVYYSDLCKEIKKEEEEEEKIFLYFLRPDILFLHMKLKTILELWGEEIALAKKLIKN